MAQVSLQRLLTSGLMGLKLKIDRRELHKVRVAAGQVQCACRCMRADAKLSLCILPHSDFYVIHSAASRRSWVEGGRLIDKAASRAPNRLGKAADGDSLANGR